MKIFVLVLISYLCGTISPSILLSKYKGIDIRKEGSGNAGTTNVLRVMGKKYAVITLIIDVLKGFIPVFIILNVFDAKTAMVCSVAVVMGHIFPVFFGFRGGKGVATSFGVILAINYILALISIGIVMVIVLISKKMSLGAIIAAISFVPLSYFFQRDYFIYGTIIIVVMLFKHIPNIKRLIRGEESTIIGSKSK